MASLFIWMHLMSWIRTLNPPWMSPQLTHIFYSPFRKSSVTSKVSYTYKKNEWQNIQRRKRPQTWIKEDSSYHWMLRIQGNGQYWITCWQRSIKPHQNVYASWWWNSESIYYIWIDTRAANIYLWTNGAVLSLFTIQDLRHQWE